MEKKQGFFSALKDEVVRGLSPAKSRGRSPNPTRSGSPSSGLLRRRKGDNRHVAQPEPFISRSGSLIRPLETLSPLMERPDPDRTDGGYSKMDRWGHWMTGQICRAPPSAPSSSAAAYQQRSDLMLLLGVLGA